MCDYVHGRSLRHDLNYMCALEQRRTNIIYALCTKALRICLSRKKHGKISKCTLRPRSECNIELLGFLGQWWKSQWHGSQQIQSQLSMRQGTAEGELGNKLKRRESKPPV